MTERTQMLKANTTIKAQHVAIHISDEEAEAFREGVKISLERARLLTESFKTTEGQPMVMRRAKALAHILENMTVYIQPGELIVGNFSSDPESVVHYPEYQWKWVERDTAPGGVYSDLLDDEGRRELREIDSYWEETGLSLHHMIKNHFPDELKRTVFPWVTNWDYATPNYEKIFQMGLNGIIEEVKARSQQLDQEYMDGAVNGVDYVKKETFLEAALISLNSAIAWARRYAKLARKMAKIETDTTRKAELERIAETCDWVPANPPRTLVEAMQCHYFTHLIIGFIDVPQVGCGLRYDVAFGPFYDKDLEEGRITRDEAQELVECLFVKTQETGFLHPPIWSGGGGGGVGWQNITIGGVDRDGQDVTNEMTYMVLDAMRNIRTISPPLSLRWHDRMPRELIDKTVEVFSTGVAQPGIFNDKVIIPRLLNFGCSLSEARNYAINNCMYPYDQGKNLITRASWCNGIPLAFCLELALNQGVSPVMGKVPTCETPDPRTFTSAEEVIDAVMEHFGVILRQMVLQANIVDALYQEYCPRPFLSPLLDGCIERAQDCREWTHLPDYRTVILLGLNNTADSIAAIKKLVFEEKKVSMETLLDALKKNWEGYEELRQMCLQCPKFGNDDDYVDLISRELAERVSAETKKHTTNYGTHPVVDGSAASSFWMAGKAIGATPDGRRAGESLHDGSISPVAGRDHNGPTAALNSVAKVDPLTTWNPLFNQNFMPEYLKGSNAELFADYLRVCGDMGIHHIQFTVVGKETLQDAQEHPQEHSDLLVRVCGYSAYFVDLHRDLQNTVIDRTSQCLTC